MCVIIYKLKQNHESKFFKNCQFDAIVYAKFKLRKCFYLSKFVMITSFLVVAAFLINPVATTHMLRTHCVARIFFMLTVNNSSASVETLDNLYFLFPNKTL